jgi:hypothetical protein
MKREGIINQMGFTGGMPESVFVSEKVFLEQHQKTS